jgi:hypothetical protein
MTAPERTWPRLLAALLAREDLSADDTLLDGLPPEALQAVQRLAAELAVRESMIFPDGPGFTGDPPGLRTVQRGRPMLVYLTDVRGERASSSR